MQQIPFIDLFKIGPTCFGRQIRPSSGALLTVYTAFGTTQRHCRRPVTRFHLNRVTGRQQCRCIVHSNAHKVIAVFFLSPEQEVT
jgi:hypothetical protein